MKKIFVSIVLVLVAFTGFAQTKADITSGTPVTWLGLDFTQLKFIGSAAQFKDAGEISNYDLRAKYFPGWNTLFLKEKEKFNVAKALDRNDANIDYAIEVTDAANGKSSGPYFTDNSGDFQLLTADRVSTLVAKYDFKGHKGLGLMFFVEGMSKDREEASMWVTFVNMGEKKVLLTKRVTGRSGGFGLRNYWAKSFYNVLQDMGHDLGKWK
ncbi:MAG: hypothetical protein K0Q79_1731 [Flavipsychrobacter sp.]|jgi:hypothetical protein|nr:hypothetical protein [Flavipsychrobacter sp.]